MDGSKWKRWAAGICAAVMMAGVPATVGYATEMTVTNTTPGSDTTVEAEVVKGSNDPTYEITIPQTVNFGQIEKPMTNVDNYATTTIELQCTRAEGLSSGETIAVLVKDSTAENEKSPFELRNGNGNILQYEMYNRQNVELHQTAWYTNGFLAATFTGSGQSEELTLKLNRALLWDKDLTTWGGKYTGTLSFHTRIAGITDIVHSMPDGDYAPLQPVV